YEQKRRVARIQQLGGIEQEFGSASLYSLANPSEPPWGFCLDRLFAGGAVAMSTGSDSLQSLFRVSRKSLPAVLPRSRDGRAILYDYRALLISMHVLLSSNRWLSDPGRRKTVLSGVVWRAMKVASPDIAAAVDSTLAPFLV
ncbi:MAG: hypothetical protein ABJB09_03880, partial [Verrucomicrobiota bacterium]